MQRLPQLTDVVLQDGVTYKRAWPDGIEDLVFVDQPTGVIDKNFEYCKRLRRKI